MSCDRAAILADPAFLDFWYISQKEPELRSCHRVEKAEPPKSSTLCMPNLEISQSSNIQSFVLPFRLVVIVGTLNPGSGPLLLTWRWCLSREKTEGDRLRLLQCAGDVGGCRASPVFRAIGGYCNDCRTNLRGGAATGQGVTDGSRKMQAGERRNF
jgi:hypothetical protein